MRTLTLLAAAALLAAQESERSIAEWIIRTGGGIAVVGAPDTIRDLDKLPPGDLRIALADFTGTLINPDDLKRLRHLAAIRELYLPAPMWNEGAGSRRDSNEAFEYLSGLKTLEKIHTSVHFLTTMNIQDKGLALLRPLSNLREVRMQQSRIKGHTLTPFVNLRSVDMSYTQFDDTGMESLKDKLKMEHLIVKDTLVTDAGLAHIANLAGLTHLDLYGCRVTDVGVRALAKLTKLRKLNLLGAKVTDEGLDALAGMSELEELNLYRSSVTNAGLAKLRHMRGLRILDLRYSRVTRAGIDEFKRAVPGVRIDFLDAAPARPVSAAPPKGPGDAAVAEWIRALGGKADMEGGRLVSANLAGMAVTDSQVSNLSRCAALRRVDLSATEVGDLGLKPLAALAALEEVNLSHTLVTDRGVEQLPVGIKRLSLNHTGVRGNSLPRFAALEDLELSGAPVVDDSLVAIAKLARLRRLRLSHADFSSEGLGPLGSLSNLRVLDLGSNDIDDKGLASLSPLTGLVELSLGYGRYTDEGLKHLKPLVNLEKLELNRTRVGDKGLPNLAALPRLRSLNLNYTQVTDAGLDTIKSMAELRELSLDTGVITDKGLPALESMKGLRWLNIYHTLVTERGQNRLRESLPGCRIVFDRDSAMPNRRGS
jgi:Leucine-rich repeat (LRR) protein